jgi:hypothetical protein
VRASSYLLLFAPLFPVGCTSGLSGVDDTEGDSDTDADGDSDADSDADADSDGDIDGDVDGGADDYAERFGISGDDPDCEAIDLDGCEEPVVIEGATRFYVGELQFDADDNVSGYEAKVIFANAAWKENNPTEGFDCLIVWTVTNGEKSTGTGAYDYDVSFHAELDTSRSTCTSGLTNAEGPFDTTYHVGVAGDHASVYFESGNAFADGTATAHAISYASPGSCEYYGSGQCNY